MSKKELLEDPFHKQKLRIWLSEKTREIGDIFDPSKIKLPQFS